MKVIHETNNYVDKKKTVKSTTTRTNETGLAEALRIPFYLWSFFFVFSAFFVSNSILYATAYAVIYVYTID